MLGAAAVLPLAGEERQKERGGHDTVAPVGFSSGGGSGAGRPAPLLEGVSANYQAVTEHVNY